MRKLFNHIALLSYAMLSLSACNKDINPNFDGTPESVGFKSRMTYDGTNLYTINGTSVKIFDLQNARNPSQRDEITIGPNLQSIHSARGLVAVGVPLGFNLFSIVNSQPLQPLFSIGGDGAMSIAIDTPFIYTGQGKNDVFATSTPIPRNGLYLFNVGQRSGLVYSIPLDDVTGLAVKDSLLFVCSGNLRVYVRRTDPSNPLSSSLQIKKVYPLAADNVTVTVDNRLIITSPTAISQCAYTDNTITYLNTIPISPH